MGRYEEISKELKAQPKVWLVTGAAGFIGSHLVDRLLELNQKVIGLDNFSTGNQKNIDYLNSRANNNNFEFIEGDIRNPDDVQKALKNVNYVLHQAALGSVPRSIELPIASHDSNVNGFINILKAATDLGVSKFVYASSSSVYGDSETLPKVEGDEGDVLSPYAATKKIDEIYAGVFHKAYNSPCVGLRYFNVFGARQDPNGPYAAVIPLWVKAMLLSEKSFINGDGSYSRDFCYIENVIQANLLAATSDDGASGKNYNIALGDRTTLLELYQHLKAGLEELKPGIGISDPEHREFRKGDVPHSHANIDLAKKYLNFAPQVKIKEGILLTLKAYLEDQE